MGSILEWNQMRTDTRDDMDRVDDANAEALLAANEQGLRHPIGA
jgi:hypothetical protein